MFKLISKNILTLLIAFLPIYCFSQNRYVEGYLITSAGEKLKGYVSIGEKSFSPEAVKFKANLGDKPLVYDIQTSLGFGIDQMESYERHSVKLSLGEVNLSNVRGGIDTSWVWKTVFLKVLQKGQNVTLYEYSDKIKTRFYIGDNSSEEPEELMLYRYIESNARTFTTSSLFRNQLVLWFRKYNVSEKNDLWLNRANYGRSDMLKAVALINNEIGKKKDVVANSKYPRHSFYVGFGLLSSKLKHDGTNIFRSTAVLDGSVLPYFVVGADIYANPVYRRLFFKPELGVSMTKNSIVDGSGLVTSKEIYTYQLRQTNVYFNPSVGYNLLSKPNYSFYFGGGVGIYYAFASKNTYTMSDDTGETLLAEPKISLLTWDLSLKLGGRIGKKLEFAASYGFPSLVNDQVRFTFFRTRIQAGVNYHF
ncbi:hypothetical protein [Pedobacter xixiisoli]|uniref:Outer membrane protein beta-barrel domain-containing protein n=1 Tax=Pedobacter xixiisoli TaxID=1476464 RepID=A0A286A9D5_9SPHI|nr:hypothetical protein [Pedobacter xixiisoli]SOD18502.1 hypothetical protein SAMN06297358_3040 [Pedobacter xixiisoli]